MLEAGDIGAIRAHMNAGRDPGCHTMNASLEALLAAHKVSVEDARNASTDRVGFAEMV
jgi:twitching motility protein PilT